MSKVLLATVALCVLSTAGAADETLKLRFIYYATSLQSQNAADVNGHIIAVSTATGGATMPDGSVVADKFVAGLDYVNGSGPFTAYGEMTFADGSVIHYKNVGQAAVADGKTTFKGNATIIDGKGKYSGAKGDGTNTGGRVGTTIPGSGILLYADSTFIVRTGDQADAAKTMLTKAVAAVKADRDTALAMFNKGEGGFLQGDLYPFCYRMSDGKAVAGGAVLNGTDLRTVKDPNGKASGLEIYAGGQKPEGQITEVTYVSTKFGTTEPVFPKVSFVTRVSDLVCGVGYYK